MLNSYSSTRNYPYYKLIVLFADLLVVNSLYWALYALQAIVCRGIFSILPIRIIGLR